VAKGVAGGRFREAGLPRGFHEAEAGAIHELGGELPGSFEMRENGLDFLAGQQDQGGF
jgi:hypothetical protein